MIRFPVHGRVSAGLLIVIAAFAAGLGLWFGNRWYAPDQPTLQSAVLYPHARPVPEFELDRADGGKLTLADWKGRWNLVFIGFTHCPDVCPTALGTLKRSWAQWQSQGRSERIRVNFISVDPERDTREVLRDYVAFFSPDFIGATGSGEQLKALSGRLGMVYARSGMEGGSYSVDHSANILIIDDQGRLAGMFRPGNYTADSIVADLNRLMDKGS